MKYAFKVRITNMLDDADHTVFGLSETLEEAVNGALQAISKSHECTPDDLLVRSARHLGIVYEPEILPLNVAGCRAGKKLALHEICICKASHSGGIHRFVIHCVDGHKAFKFLPQLFAGAEYTLYRMSIHCVDFDTVTQQPTQEPEIVPPQEPQQPLPL